MEVKWPGSLHDARFFSNCDVQKRFSDGKLDLFHKELLPEEEYVAQLLLGDPAFPLLPYVMKEFDHCSINEEVIFNQMLRAARNQIAFGRLKTRWRILLGPMDIPVQKLSNVIFACFVLHNFCERQKTDVDTALAEEIILKKWSKTIIDKVNSYTTPMGRKVRNPITSYFKEHL